ncbi:lipocalin-like domain-containing protein [Hymenobacter tibetensis]|uniref:Lipocalin-like domain-containing protein n=1 Tax=Hymenobacter tibetensis TaxID=497967 RepID=A0ABY4CTI4_9BACT|nr:lipocalin-like domain-containing protein [Hymenobacter tibetensis]UOG73426.1 lipocalin-like domain-containing protein [Hymenobacter tibetensis]
MKPVDHPLVGTWQLLRATTIEKGDTTVVDFTRKQSFIKIINDTHFAFLQHDLQKGQDSAVFVSGGGRYSLRNDMYTEQLDYCTARKWEGTTFSFTVAFKGDTLIQQGQEQVEQAGINRVIVEHYVRVKN